MCSMHSIFAVDDNPLFIDLITTVFTQAGYRVRTTCDPAAALTEILAQPPDLALIDVVMPRMSGFELATAIQRQSREFIPVLLMTAGMYQVNRLPGNIIGMLVKPLDMAELVSLVHGVVRTSGRGSALTCSENS